MGMSYTWVFLSLIAAFTLATSDALTKKALTQKNEYLVAWSRLLFSVPLLVLLWLSVPRPKLDYEFWRAFVLALPLEITALILYIKALRISPLSLTLPFLSLTPVFLILVSYLIIGERVSLKGIVGIFLLAAGSYTMNLREIRKGIVGPFRAVTKEKGSVLMIVVALIYSITSSLGKVAIIHSSPLFFGTTYFIILTVIFAPVACWMDRYELKRFISEKQYKGLFAPGLLYSIMVVSHMGALSLTKVAYMISLKRTSLLVGVIYGYFFFREKNIQERFAGALLMFIGFVMIVTAE
jgi:drug/metabolite transporter (DMT)-like permease